MRLTTKDLSLHECLKEARISELPEGIPSDSTAGWLRAIALTTKVGGVQEYCLVSKDNDGGIRVRKNCGTPAVIISFDEIYPYEFLDAKYTPTFSTDHDIIEFLVAYDYDEKEVTRLLSKRGKSAERQKADRDVINGYIQKVTVEYANQMKKEEDRCANPRDYKSRIR